MKAMGVTGPEFVPRLFDVDEPIVAPEGVVVDVMAASINDFDRAAVRGRYLAATDRLVPILLGRDFVGRVAAVGDDVDYIGVGMYVAGILAPQPTGQPGTFTDKVEVPARLLAPVPDGVEVAQAAAVGLAGVTAFQAIEALGPHGLGTIAIHGPVSGVGGFALQLAKARGAVVAAITPPARVDLALGLGADVVVLGRFKPCSINPRGAQHLRRRRRYRDPRRGTPLRRRRLGATGRRFTSAADGPTFDARGGFRPTNVAPSGHVLTDLLFKVAAGRLVSRVHRTVAFDELAGAVIARSGHDGGRIVLVR